MADKAVELVHLRNNFYRDSYRKVLFVLFFMLIANVMLVFGIMYVIKNPPQPKYFATNDDGRITLIHPLSAPVMSVNALS